MTAYPEAIWSGKSGSGPLTSNIGRFLRRLACRSMTEWQPGVQLGPYELLSPKAVEAMEGDFEGIR